MPIAAVPAGVEIRKISAVQKRALDELLGKETEGKLLETVIRASIPAVTAISIAAGAGVLIWSYLKDKELPTGKEIAEIAGGGVANAIIDAGGAVLEKVAPDLANKPTTPKELTLASGEVVELTLCQRWEYDAADLLAIIQSKGDMGKTETTLAALSVLRIVKNMKKDGCPKPNSITQAQWNEG
jgi:hypothetical protein